MSFSDTFPGSGDLDAGLWQSPPTIFVHGGEVPPGLQQSGGNCVTDAPTIDGTATYGEAVGVADEPTPDYYVEARCSMPYTTANFEASAVIILYGRAADFDSSCYLIELTAIDDGGNNIRLLLDAVYTLGTLPIDIAVADPTDFRVRLHMNGTTIRALVDGVEVASFDDASVAGPGKAGLLIGNNRLAGVNTTNLVHSFVASELIEDDVVDTLVLTTAMFDDSDAVDRIAFTNAVSGAALSSADTQSIAFTSAAEQNPGYNVVDTLALTNASASTGAFINEESARAAFSDAVALQIPTVTADTLALTDAQQMSVASATVTGVAFTSAAATQAAASNMVADTIAFSDETAVQQVAEAADTIAFSTAAVSAIATNADATLALTDAQARAVAGARSASVVLSDATQSAGSFNTVDTIVLRDTTPIESDAIDTIAFSDQQRHALTTNLVDTLALSSAVALNLNVGADVSESVALSSATQSDIASLHVERIDFDDAVLQDQSALDRIAFTDAQRLVVVTVVVDNMVLSDAAPSAVRSVNTVVDTLTLSSAAVGQNEASTLVAESVAFTSAATSNLSAAQNEVVDYLILDDATIGGGAAGAWTAHLETFAMSRYAGYAFNSMAEVDGVLLGADDNGLFRLDGDDDAGEPIAVSVEHDWLDGGDPHLKHPRYLYANGTNTGQMVVRLGYVDNNGIERFAEYPFEARHSAGFGNNRAKLGRGIRSRYLQPTLMHVSELNDSQLVHDPSNRRL